MQLYIHLQYATATVYTTGSIKMNCDNNNAVLMSLRGEIIEYITKEQQNNPTNDVYFTMAQIVCFSFEILRIFSDCFYVILFFISGSPSKSKHCDSSKKKLMNWKIKIKNC